MRFFDFFLSLGTMYKCTQFWCETHSMWYWYNEAYT